MNETITALGIIIGLIVLGGAAFFIGIHTYAYLWILRDSLRVSHRLRKIKRIIPLNEAVEKMKKKEGFIIVDAPTLGWNVSRVWWSSETDFLPRTFKTDEDEFFPPEDPINYDRFIDPTKGCAKLVSGFVFTQNLKAYLEKNFDIEEAPFIFTGGVLFLRNTHPN